MSLDTTLALMGEVPADRLLVTESRHPRPATMCSACGDAGVNAFLVGEAFMRADEPGEALAELFGDVSKQGALSMAQDAFFRKA